MVTGTLTTCPVHPRARKTLAASVDVRYSGPHCISSRPLLLLSMQTAHLVRALVFCWVTIVLRIVILSPLPLYPRRGGFVESMTVL